MFLIHNWIAKLVCSILCVAVWFFGMWLIGIGGALNMQGAGKVFTRFTWIMGFLLVAVWVSL